MCRDLGWSSQRVAHCARTEANMISNGGSAGVGGAVLGVSKLVASVGTMVVLVSCPVFMLTDGRKEMAPASSFVLRGLCP